MEDELFEIYDEHGTIIAHDTRANAHRLGLWHAVIHVWLYEKKDDILWVYLQQRSYTKKDFAGQYDITTAGHVDVQELKEVAAIRECKEEIGIALDKDVLQYLEEVKEAVYQSSTFIDKEIAHVFLGKVNHPNFVIGEEVEQLVKVKAEDILRYAKDKRRGLIVSSLDDTKRWKIEDSELCNHASIYYKWIIKNMEESYGTRTRTTS